MTTKFQTTFNSERRLFIKGLGWVGLGLVSATLLGGCESLKESIRNRPVRRRLRSGSAAVDNDIAIYRDAVAAMKALPNSDPRSWFAQAAIHGTANVGFNLCQHGTQHFFSWHRAYLLYFERICQALTGEPNFGLPYWNWNQDPDVHNAFLDNTSALFEGSRVNTSVAGVSNFTDATLNPIFDDLNFLSFGSQIESTPHNRGHTRIGGILGGFGSASDPLFWAHHCMVDYCWAKWNVELGRDNTDDPNWLGTEWDHFVDGNGDAVTVTAGLTTIMPLLSYRYECSRIGKYGCPLDISALSNAEFRELEARVRRGTRVRFDIRHRVPIGEAAALPIGRPAVLRSKATVANFSSVLGAGEADERVFLSIRFADLPERNDFFLRAFINLPEASASTAIDSDHYAGAFSFFGTSAKGDHDHHSHAPGFLINVTEKLRVLLQEGLAGENEALTVTLVAMPEAKEMGSPEQVLQLTALELLVSPLGIESEE